MLLVLVFYMGIDDGGKTQEHEATVQYQTQEVVRFKPTRDRWKDKEMQ